MPSQLIKRIEKLQGHKDIKNHTGIQKQLAGLKNTLLHYEKVSGKYSYYLDLTMDGVPPEEAEFIVGLRKRED